MIQLAGTRRMIVRLVVQTAALIVSASGGRLQFNSPSNSGLLGVL